MMQTDRTHTQSAFGGEVDAETLPLENRTSSPKGAAIIAVPSLKAETHDEHSATVIGPPEVNPFFYDAEASSGFFQYVKMFVVGITLFPIRALVFVLILIVAWIVCKLMTLTVSDDELHAKPLRRPVLRFLFRKCARIALWCLGFWWVKRTGTEHLDVDWQEAMIRLGHTNREASSEASTSPQTDRKFFHAPILVANHSSLIDTMYLAAYHDFMAVGKVELLSIPLFGGICKALQYIPVKRESPENRKAVSREICRRTVMDKNSSNLQEPWQRLVIFPEATCTNTRSVIQFKLGAFIPGCPVQPTVLRYPYKHLMMDWVGPSTLHGLIFKSMLQVYNNLEVEYLPIHFPTEEERKDVSKFAQHVREGIGKALGVPLTEHTFEDVQLINEANLLQLPFLDQINVAMGLPQNQSLGIEKAKQKLREFAQWDTDGDGYLNRNEFGMFLNLQPRNGPSDPAKIAMRDAIFDRWMTLSMHARKKKAATDGKEKAEGKEDRVHDKTHDVIDFAAFLAVTAAQKVRLRRREQRRHTATSDSQNSTPKSLTLGNSFFLDEANDAEIMYCVTLCFGSFDGDHDGKISRAEFVHGLSLVCPSLSLASHSNGGGGGDESVIIRHAWTDEGDHQVQPLNAPASDSIPLRGPLDALFDEVDVNRDGWIELEEFVAFAKTHPAFLHHLLDTMDDLNGTEEF